MALADGTVVAATGDMHLPSLRQLVCLLLVCITSALAPSGCAPPGAALTAPVGVEESTPLDDAAGGGGGAGGDAAGAEAPGGTSLWAPKRLSIGSPLAPLRVAAHDPSLEGERVEVVADRALGLVTRSRPLSLSEVGGAWLAENGPALSLPRQASVEELGPLTLTLRRVDAPDEALATTVVEIVEDDGLPSADACLGGGNVAVWERLSSYAGRSGGVVQVVMSGPFEALERRTDWQGEEGARHHEVSTSQGRVSLATPTDTPIEVGVPVQGSAHFPGPCASGSTEIVFTERVEGTRLSELRRRIDRLTVAWRTWCPVGDGIALRGCAHFDARSPQIGQ